MPFPFAIAGAALFGGLSAAAQSSVNSAVRKAAEAEQRQVVRAGIDQKIQRAERAQQFLGMAQAGRGAAFGTGRTGGGGGVNIRELVEQAYGDAAADILVINQEVKTRLDAIKSQVKSQTRSPFLAGAMGALSGYSLGSQIAAMLPQSAAATSPMAFLTPEQVPGDALPAAAPGTSFAFPL